MWRMVRFLECTDKMCRVPFCMYGPSRPCSRDAAHGAFFGVYREDVPCAILHARSEQACAAEMRRTVQLLECTDQTRHMPLCMHGQGRPMQQRCGARCNFHSVQTRSGTCHSACMGGLGLRSRCGAWCIFLEVYRPDVPHAILYAWPAQAGATEMRRMA